MGSFASLLETIAEVDTVPKEAKTPRVTNRDQRERIVCVLAMATNSTHVEQEEGA